MSTHWLCGGRNVQRQIQTVQEHRPVHVKIGTQEPGTVSKPVIKFSVISLTLSQDLNIPPQL